MVVENREWYLCAYAPEGVPTTDHIKLRTVTLSLSPDSMPDQHVALQFLYFSIDPFIRSTICGHEDGLYMSQLALNQAVSATGIGKVVRSKDSKYTEGVPGFTAWVGMEVIAKTKPESNVFILAAAGGVGMFAGQLAKIKGCRFIGSTGSDEKVKLLKEEFGYDDAFNYHTETDLDAALRKFIPDGIDIYFDSVGGKMLAAVLNHVSKGARIPVCGMISEYNTIWMKREGVKNLLNLLGKGVRMEGFLIVF